MLKIWVLKNGRYKIFTPSDCSELGVFFYFVTMYSCKYSWCLKMTY